MQIHKSASHIRLAGIKYGSKNQNHREFRTEADFELYSVKFEIGFSSEYSMILFLEIFFCLRNWSYRRWPAVEWSREEYVELNFWEESELLILETS
jgi:hypothetical protein